MDITRRKKIAFSVVTAILSGIIFLVSAELLIRLFSPVESMNPRMKYSSSYGISLHEDCQIVHERPGKWRFLYTINEYGYRGPAIAISNAYPRSNVVLLGDSYTFGEGVSDSECFAVVMASHLRDRFNVVNLGVPGWALTQEIRRYYEFGRLYDPSVVILQFCGNDPEEDLEYPVASARDGRFYFHSCRENPFAAIKNYLSYSWVQRSELYSYVVQVTFRLRHDRPSEEDPSVVGATKVSIPFRQQYYNELLALFARDLSRCNKHLIMIAVNGQLDRFPFIKAKIRDLQLEGFLEYLEVRDWGVDVESYRSPEGHWWGTKAHKIIGEKLAESLSAHVQ